MGAHGIYGKHKKEVVMREHTKKLIDEYDGTPICEYARRQGVTYNQAYYAICKIAKLPYPKNRQTISDKSIEMYKYMLEHPEKILKEVGEVFGVSKQRVHQIKVKMRGGSR